MEQVKLTDEQLLQLITYIDSRGFHDTGAIAEILDHFACKVEEKLTVNNSLSMEEAMREAHASFGQLGFYPLVVSYEKNIRRKYTALYRQERNRVLTSPAYVTSGLLAAVLMYFGYVWGNTHALVWDINLFSLLLYAVFIIADIIFLFRFRIGDRKCKITETILYKNAPSLILVTFLMPLGHHYSDKIVVFPAIMAAAACFYLVTRYAAVYATMKTGIKEVKLVHDYLKRKGWSYLP